MGDWNFVEGKVDRSSQHDNDPGVTGEMTKLKASLDLVDGWRLSNLDSRSFSWEGRLGSNRKKIILRINQIYMTKDTWNVTNKYNIHCNHSACSPRGFVVKSRVTC